MTGRARLRAPAALIACMAVAGCSRHNAGAPAPVAPLHAKAGPGLDAFWSVAAPAIVHRYEDGPRERPIDSPDMQPRAIAIAPDGAIDAGEFKARAADATWWALRRSGIDGGGVSTVYTLGGAGWQLDVHMADVSDLAEVTVGRDGVKPGILYSTATVPRQTRPAAAPAYDVAGKMVAPGTQTLPGTGKTEVDLAAGRVVVDGRAFSLAGTRDETVQYADGRLTYLGVTKQADALTIEYRDGRLAGVSGP